MTGRNKGKRKSTDPTRLLGNPQSSDEPVTQPEKSAALQLVRQADPNEQLEERTAALEGFEIAQDANSAKAVVNEAPGVAEQVTTEQEQQNTLRSEVDGNWRDKEPSGERKVALDALLRAKGFSLSSWASKAGVDRHAVSRYRNGKGKPHPSTLWKLANALDVSIDELPK
jgi:DNA-binding Xre family transcriptional regulator